MINLEQGFSIAMVAVLHVAAIATWQSDIARRQPFRRLSAVAQLTWSLGILGDVGAESGWGAGWETLSIAAYLVTIVVSAAWYIRKTQKPRETER